MKMMLVPLVNTQTNLEEGGMFSISPSENFVDLPSLHAVSLSYLASFPGPIRKIEKGQMFGWGLGMRLYSLCKVGINDNNDNRNSLQASGNLYYRLPDACREFLLSLIPTLFPSLVFSYPYSYISLVCSDLVLICSDLGKYGSV